MKVAFFLLMGARCFLLRIRRSLAGGRSKMSPNMVAGGGGIHWITDTCDYRVQYVVLWRHTQQLGVQPVILRVSE